MLSFLIFLMSSCQTLSLIPPVLHHILWFQRGGVLRRCRQMQVATECLWIKNPCRVSDDFGDFQNEFVLVDVVCFYLISHYRRAILSHLALFNHIFVDVTSAKNPWIICFFFFPSPGFWGWICGVWESKLAHAFRDFLLCSGSHVVGVSQVKPTIRPRRFVIWWLLWERWIKGPSHICGAGYPTVRVELTMRKQGIDRVRFSCPIAAKATEHLVSFSHKWYLKMVTEDMSGSMALPNSDL